jgi:hypothetical protein
MTCDQDHESETITVEADNDESALEEMTGKMKAHLAENHSDKNMSDDETREYIKANWTKEDSGSEAEGSDDDEDDDEDDDMEDSDDDDDSGDDSSDNGSDENNGEMKM